MLSGNRALQAAVPFESELWTWRTAEPTPAEYLGRKCVSLESSTATVADVEFADGAIEVDLAVGRERGFHGVAWRVRDDENFESFFVRPHQVGNPDAVQYTPVFNGISSWQLYHGPGYWAPSRFRSTAGSGSASSSRVTGLRCTSLTWTSRRSRSES